MSIRDKQHTTAAGRPALTLPTALTLPAAAALPTVARLPAVPTAPAVATVAIGRFAAAAVLLAAIACANPPAPADPTTPPEPAAPSGSATPEPAPPSGRASPADPAPPSGSSIPPEPAPPGDGGSPAQPAAPRRYGYEIVARYPHDEAAFTQGLAYHEGTLYEGTGRRGESSLRQVELETGRTLRRVDLDPSLFGEGVAILDDRIYQLTWLSGRALVYTLDDFAPVGERPIATEGWGLTAHEGLLVMSDGSATLYQLDPATFDVVGTVTVRDGERAVSQLNELEVVDGEIWANVWHSEEILRIDPGSGAVTGRIDMSGLRRPDWRQDPEAVLNGIAHDPETGRTFVTGKLWPVLYEVRIVASR